MKAAALYLRYLVLSSLLIYAPYAQAALGQCKTSIIDPVRPPLAYHPCNPSFAGINTIFITDDSPTSHKTFMDTVIQNNKTICLADVTLDFSYLAANEFPFRVGANINIYGTRTARNPGSTLKLNKKYTNAFLLIDKDNIKIDGVRIIGPDSSINNDLEIVGVRIRSAQGVDIGNVEVSGWKHAIDIRDPSNCLNRTQYNNTTATDDVRIHDSYLHHNQTKGEGYGVGLGESAYALIERNLFDFNRHAIATHSGNTLVGYYAYRNLVLKGGGNHKGYATHQFDMHGTYNDFFEGEHKGGQAGEYVILGENTMQYSIGNGYYLRGVPIIKTNSYNNFFAQSYYAGGLILDGAYAVFYPPYEKYINSSNIKINYDTYGKYKVCDIDKDGKDDLMQPAGATWWYSSGAKMPWTFAMRSFLGFNEILASTQMNPDGYCDMLVNYNKALYIYTPLSATQIPLNTIPTAFNDIRLGDFDGDGYQDFFKTYNQQWSYFSTRTRTWTNIQTSSYPLSTLTFGDFNGDKKTDVLGLGANGWNVSWSGTSSWQKVNNKLSTDIQNFKIADVNGDGKDDIALISIETKWGYDLSLRPVVAGYNIKTYTSLSASTAWITKTHYIPHLVGFEGSQPIKYFIGKFDNNAGADLLIVDTLRNGYVSSGFSSNLQKYTVDHFNY